MRAERAAAPGNIARIVAELRGYRPLESSRAILRRAFDLGITHFDLANNYGPPYGSAEESFGRVMATDFRASATSWSSRPRPATTCGPGPTGKGVARGSTCLPVWTRAWAGWAWTTWTSSTRTASTRTRRLKKPSGALDTAVRQGKALYVGISSYSAAKTREAAGILRELGTPLLIHQPSYSLFNRWIEPDLLDVLGEEGIGCIAFSPLAQGLLTDRYLGGVPEGSRASAEGSLAARDAERRKSRQGTRPGGDRRRPGPKAVTVGPGMVTSRPEGHLSAHRRQQHRSARGQRGRAAKP